MLSIIHIKIQFNFKTYSETKMGKIDEFSRKLD